MCSLTKKMSRFRKLLRIWGCTCFYCGEGFSVSRPATLEHLIPRSLGGTKEIGNLALAHEKCNSIRGNAPLVAALRVFDTFKVRSQRSKALHPYKEMANDLARKRAA